jgi:hypothetical protein
MVIGATARTRPRGPVSPSNASARRDRAQRCDRENEQCLSKIIALLRRGAGVTQILDTIAQPEDTPQDAVRRARLLRSVLETVAQGSMTLSGLKAQKASRSLSYLEGEIAWLENAASGPPNHAA